MRYRLPELEKKSSELFDRYYAWFMENIYQPR